MKIILTILVLFSVRIAFSQNHFTSKIAAGVHAGTQTVDHRNYFIGLLISGFAEPRITNSGNLVFNMDFANVIPDGFTSTEGKGRYGVFAGYKQKIFFKRHKNDLYFSALAGIFNQSFSVKAMTGYEFTIMKKSLMSIDASYSRSFVSSTSSKDKILSYFGITIGVGVINK